MTQRNSCCHRMIQKVRAVARPWLGPAFRRAIREAQWWQVRGELATTRVPDTLPFTIASHETPLIRPLLRLDEQLQRNKIVNLRIAADQLHGLELKPGQRMSFWRLVGKPSYRRGFLDGLVLHQGRLGAGVGGGLCQMTNLLYWMTLHTPLLIAERWRHSFDVFPDAGRTQPFGSGATCSWPALDLQIFNPTAAIYRLSMVVGATHLQGAWTATRPSDMSYRIEERAHHFTHDGPGAYMRHNELWRVETEVTTGVTREVFLVANEARLTYEPFLAGAEEDSGNANPAD